MPFGSSGTNDIKIFVELVTDKATDGAKKLDDALNDVKKSASDSDKEVSNLTKSLTTLGGGTAAAVAGIAAIGGAAVGITVQLLSVASEIEGLQAQFNKLNLEAGANPAEQIEKLSAATRGLLTDSQIFEQFNKAATLGLPVERFEELSAAAVKVGRSIGVDAQTAIESFTVGVGRQSIQMLDNLGIIIKSEEAYQKFAQANNIVGRELNDTEKKMAFQVAAIDSLVAKSEEAVEIQETAAIAFQKLQTAITNQVADAAIAVSQNENLKNAIQNLTDEISNLDFSNFTNGLAEISALFINVAAEAISAAQSISEFMNSTAGFDNFVQNFKLGAGYLLGGESTAKGQFKKIMEENKAAVEAVDAAVVKVDKNIKATDVSTEKLKETGKKTKTEFEKFSEALHKSLTKASPEFDALKNKAFELSTEMLKTGEASDVIQKKLEDLARSGGPLDAITAGFEDANKELEKQAELEAEINELVLEAIGKKEDLHLIAKRISEEIDLTTISAEDFKSVVEDQNLSLEQQKELVKEIADAEREATQAASERNAEIASGISDLISTYGNLSLDNPAGIGSAAGDLSQYAGLSSAAGSYIALIAQAIAGGINGVQSKKPELDRNPQNYQNYGQELEIAFLEGVGDAFGGLGNERKIQEFSRKFIDTMLSVFSPATKAFASKNSKFGDITAGPLSGLQSVFGVFGSNDPGQRSRKAIIDTLNDMVGELRLIVNGQAEDFSFKRPGQDAFGTPTQVVTPEGITIDTTQGFETLFSLGEEARTMFLEIGSVLGTSMFDGLDEFAGSGIIGQIGAMLAESTGGSLNNLQLAFESMGLSAEQLGAALENAFFVGEISAKEYLSGLNAVNELMTQGIPGAVGATMEAFENLQEGGLESGQIAQDALGDIAAEFQEIAEAQGYNANSLEDLGAQLIAAGADIEQVTTLMEVLAQQGVTTVDELLAIDTFSTANLISGLQDAGFAFEEPIQQIELMNEKMDELENRKISAYVDVNFQATGDPAAINAVEQGTGVDFGGEGRL